MAFPVKDYRQVRADILRDIANLQPKANVGKDSDFYVRATGTGSAVEGLYQHQQWIARQIFASTADVENLIVLAGGVTDVYVFPQRRNTRSIDVVIETTGGLPSSAW